jgi:hypothetical protein
VKALRLPRALLTGGSGVAVAVLVPRAASLGTQWLLALAAGPAAVAGFVSFTSRGTVIVSLVAAGLAPTLAHRARALASRSGRALAGGALAVLAALAFSGTLAFELAFGLRGAPGLVTAVFSACSLFATVSASVWPLWQREGRYLQTLAVMLALAPGASALAALAGQPAAACLATGLAGAVPALLLVGRTRLRRAIRYAIIALRRSVPLSISNFSTSVVYPAALSAGMAALGAHAVGQQALYWSFVAALSVASQSFAARAVAGASALEGDARRRAGALRAWMRPALALALTAALIYALFAIPIPFVPRSGAARDAMTPSMLVSGVAPLLTDPLCFYFSGPRSRRVLAIGSALCSAAVALCLVLVPAPLVRHLGVFGPSAFIGVLRLAFVIDPPARRAALAALAVLGAGYAATSLLGAGG